MGIENKIRSDIFLSAMRSSPVCKKEKKNLFSVSHNIRPLFFMEFKNNCHLRAAYSRMNYMWVATNFVFSGNLQLV